MNNELQTKRFVIHKHIRCGDIHWDLMLETGGVLQTYRLAMPPEEILKQSCRAEKISDHDLRFLTYQGSVNNGEGQVEITEQGTYRQAGWSEDRLELSLDGNKLKGSLTLTHTAGNNWELAKGL